ncbi:MAG: tail-specific protease [Bacteroidetes bacterium]|nr:MAG: tail-specific protease [Bacteroidota bacterium]
MNRKVIQYSLPLILIAFFAFTIYQSGRKEKILLEVLTKSLEAGHYEGYKIDDLISGRLYKKYIESLDYGKRYFLKSDIEIFEKSKYKLDDQIGDKSFDFFDQTVEIINKRQFEVEKIYSEILEKPFNFDKKEQFETDPEKLDFPKNEKERKERWRKLLKYQTLAKLNNLLTIQENAIADKDTAIKVETFEALEVEARGKIANDYKEMFRRLHRLNEKDRLSAYLNALTASYDPHSAFMPPKDKANFDISISGKFEGIGASLQEQNDGYIKVARIIPGSASWKQGQLKAGDVILKVAQGKKDPLNIVGMRLDDAVQFIRGKKGTEVRLTIKKPDGSIVIIPIIRDIVVIEETYAKSAILQKEGSDFKTGYIYLPSFYVDFSNRNGRHCSKDVKLEIEKLKHENVNGIILDLRNNGGGSLQDVVEMSGLFITEGPVVQVKGRYGKPYILKDRDPKVQYDGKLIVMVNTLSASASEILAAAMQDYNRAIIVGSPITYGKGTVQKFVDLDQMINNSYDDVKPLGSLKLTIQKFYRVNGGATQLKGVEADIILPDIYGGIEIGEREHDDVIPWDEIDAANYIKWNNPVAGINNLKEKSEKRVAENGDFNLVNENSQRMKKQREITSYSLNLKKYRTNRKKLKEESKKFDNIFKEKTSVSAYSLKEDLDRISGDSLKIAGAQEWTKSLGKDAYLEETVKIMEEMK